MKSLIDMTNQIPRHRGAALPKPPSPGCSWHGCRTRPRLLTALGLALLGALLLGLVSTLPVFAAYQYHPMVVAKFNDAAVVSICCAVGHVAWR